MAKKYEFVKDAHEGTVKIRFLDPQAIGVELAKIESANKGLTPRIVVASARPKNSVLHSAFEWDDSVAGEEYRNLQAANLIRVVRVVETDNFGEQIPVRAFIHVSNGDGSRYIRSAKVMNDEHLRSLAIAEARSYLARAKTKLQDFEELATVYKTVERAEKQLGKVA